MDIAPALTGLKYLRDFTKWVGDMRADAEVLSRTNDAMRAVGEVQDKLQELREENFRLVDENRTLTEKLREVEDWQGRRAGYQLFLAAGGGMVLRSAGPPVHYACPACAEARRQLHVLQDLGSWAGTYRCPACQVEYPVDRQRVPTIG